MINVMSISPTNFDLCVPKTVKEIRKKTEMLFVLRNWRVLICTTTAWMVLIARINFDCTTVPIFVQIID